jgi:DNA (cytosine-5)-methyltransferase 1
VRRTHVDLFSGIGGFALAASWCGVETVQFVEIDKRCREFLSKAWLGVPIHDDIRTFDGTQHAGCIGGGEVEQERGSQDGTADRRTGARSMADAASRGQRIDGGAPRGAGHADECAANGDVWLLTGGVPCQPVSCAGKRKGAADDRWLWPEALRVLGEVRPAWCLFENPSGIGGMGLNGIVADMEGQGYSVRVFSIPACAVNAPHKRERYWIVARRIGESVGNGREAGRVATAPAGHGCSAESDARGGMGNADGDRWQRRGNGPGAAGRPHAADCGSSLWSRFVWLPCADGKVRRAPDDSISLVDGLHRSLLAGLGNSIVPQVAQRIIAAMIESEE